MQRIIYFTEDAVPTSGELSAIEDLNAFVKKQYEVLVRNRKESQLYGAGAESLDFKAGTPPDGYGEVPAWQYPEPAGIEPNQAIVENGNTLAITDEGANEANATVSVSESAVTGIVLEGTATIVENGFVFEGVTGAGSATVATVTVVNGAITAIACSEPG